MQGLTGRYLNEIIGLTIMLVMIAALVASQAAATVHEGARSDSGYSAIHLPDSATSMTDATIIRANLEVQVDFTKLLDAGIEAVSGQPVREVFGVTITLDEQLGAISGTRRILSFRHKGE